MALFDVTELKGPDDGPVFLALGGIHGNEPCGSIAIRRLISDVQSGRMRITAGLLRLIPDVNTAARDANKRYIDRNLNRIIGDDSVSDNEGRIAAELRPYLEQADYLHDMHSYTVGGPAFVFAQDDPQTMAFARATNPAAIITGWNDCYRRDFPDTCFGTGTTEYARQFGAIAITHEGGQHNDPQAPEESYQSLLRAMQHAGIIDGAAQLHPDIPHFSLDKIFMKKREGQLAQNWQHLQPVKKEDIFARYDDGSVETFPSDGVVILPNRFAPVHEEWGYFGRAR